MNSKIYKFTINGHNDKNDIESIFQLFMQSKLIYIKEYKIETISYQENKLVSYDSFGNK